MAEDLDPSRPTGRREAFARSPFRLAALFLLLLLGLWLGVRFTLLALHGTWPGALRLTRVLASCDRDLPADAPSHELVEDAIAYYEGADLLYRSAALTISPPPATVVESSPARLAPAPQDAAAPRSGA